MTKLVEPHGGKELKPLLLAGQELTDEQDRAKGLKKIPSCVRPCPRGQRCWIT
jgi:hypothetical protein